MSKLKLYRVTVDHEVWVVAENESDAEDYADEALREEFDAASHAQRVTEETFPANEEESYIPYGERDESDPDRTVGEWRRVLGIESKIGERLRAKVKESRR